MSRIYFIVISLGVLMLTACDGAKNGFTVNGIVPEVVADGEVIHISDFNDGLIIDSVKVVKGSFSFKGTLKEPKAVRLSVGMFYANIILEKGVITVDMSDPNSAKGTPLTEEYIEFVSKNENLIEEARGKLMSIDDSLSESEIVELRQIIVDELFAKIDELPIPYLKKHSDDILGAMVFYTWVQNQMEPSYEKFKEYSDLVGENVLNFGPVRQMAEYYISLGKTAVGEPFVDFTIEKGNLDGTPVSLSDYVGKGQYVLVDFWASWCVPCRMEAPVIAEVYNKYKGDKFNVVSIAVWDNRDATIRAIEEDGSTWSQILDANTIPTELYGIQGIPHIMLFGPDGTIIARDLRGYKLKETVAEVMNN